MVVDRYRSIKPDLPNPLVLSDWSSAPSLWGRTFTSPGLTPLSPITKLLLNVLFLYLTPFKTIRLKFLFIPPTVVYSGSRKSTPQPSLEASTSTRDLLYHALVNVLTFDKINGARCVGSDIAVPMVQVWTEIACGVEHWRMRSTCTTALSVETLILDRIAIGELRLLWCWWKFRVMFSKCSIHKVHLDL